MTLTMVHTPVYSSGQYFSIMLINIMGTILIIKAPRTITQFLFSCSFILIVIRISSTSYPYKTDYNLYLSPLTKMYPRSISKTEGRYQGQFDIVVRQGLTKNVIAMVLGGGLIIILIILLVSSSF